MKSLAFLCTFARGKDGSAITLPMLATALRMRIGTRAQRRNAFLAGYVIRWPEWTATSDPAATNADRGAPASASPNTGP